MKTVIAASILALTCGAAHAATCTQGSVNYTLTQGSPDAVQAYQCYSGNDTNTIDANFSLGGKTGWMLADKTDDGNAYLDGGFDTFTMSPTYSWSVLNPLGYDFVMVTLKQGSSFAAFLLDSAADLSGNWFTQGPGKSTGGLSHASVYFSGEPAPAPVPLPAGAALLPAGLAALAFLRRRRKAA
jgi:hypothetical protein